MSIFLPIVFAIVTTLTPSEWYVDGTFHGTITTQRGTQAICIDNAASIPCTEEELPAELYEDGSVQVRWPDGATSGFCLNPEWGCTPSGSGISGS